MGNIKKGVKAAKQFINKIKDTIKKVRNAIKFFATPIGYVCGWGLLIIIGLILLYVVINVVMQALAWLIGSNPNYATYEEDLGYIMDLTNSGYELTVNKENFQNFQAFEYAVLMDTAEYLRQANVEQMEESEDGTSDKMELLEVGYETDQHLLLGHSIHGQDALDYLVNEATSRSVKVEDECEFIKKSGSVTGGNTRVVTPTLVYEFRVSSLNASEDEATDEKANDTAENTSSEATDTTTDETVDGTTTEATADETKTLTSNNQLAGSAQQLLTEGKGKGSLIPYVYIIREDIDFTYYFNDVNGKKKVMEYAYELNINNPYIIGSGSEFLKDLAWTQKQEPNRNLESVYPGQDYENRPIYEDVTTPIVYKIPLQTIIGRYMPRAELLLAWSILKQDIDKEDNIDEIDIVDEIIASIKGIYSEACLKDEEFTTKEGTSTSSENALYSDATTHNSTFVTFATAGIEKTMYGINDSLKAVSGKEFKIFTNCVSAAIIEEGTINVEVKYSGDGVERRSFSISKLVKDKWKNHGYVIAEESDNGGYIPPSSFESTGICAVGKSVSDVVSTLKSEIEKRLSERRQRNSRNKI